MPRSNHRRPLTPQATLITGHGCLYPRCPERCKPGQIMDGPHWESVPWAMRRRFRDAKREGTDTQEYAESLTAIVEWARSKELTAQGAR